MVNHDAPHQLRGHRDKVGPALPERLRIIDQPQVGFVENDGGLQGVAGAFPAHVMVREPVQFGLHQRKQLLQRSVVSAAPVAEQLGDLLSRGWRRCHRSCSTPQSLPPSANFYSIAGGRSKKTAHSWRVSGCLSALPHEPAQTKNAPKKPNSKMTAVITTIKNSTRFYLTEEGLATDIQNRARQFVWSYDAQVIANVANSEYAWEGFRWHVTHLLSNGMLI